MQLTFPTFWKLCVAGFFYRQSFRLKITPEGELKQTPRGMKKTYAWPNIAESFLSIYVFAYVVIPLQCMGFERSIMLTQERARFQTLSSGQPRDRDLTRVVQVLHFWRENSRVSDASS